MCTTPLSGRQDLLSISLDVRSSFVSLKGSNWVSTFVDVLDCGVSSEGHSRTTSCSERVERRKLDKQKPIDEV